MYCSGSKLIVVLTYLSLSSFFWFAMLTPPI
nr:MAG TPA: hypothetical protein [Caudoviricetes sp.]